MNDKIVNFPSNLARSWHKTSKTLKPILIEGGMSESETKEFLEGFKPTFELFMNFEYSLSLSVPESIASTVNDELSKLGAAFKEHLHELLFERLRRELEIYLAK